MPRPQSKDELLVAAKEKYNKLIDLVDLLDDDIKHEEFLFDDRDRNIRDIYIHLHEWHNLLIKWVNANKKGGNKPFLPAEYNWRTYPKMNIEFWKDHQDTPFEKAQELLESSHRKVIRIIRDFSNEELFTKKYFSWTGTSSLGSYCVSATASHYDWAMKKIKIHKNSNK